MSASIKPERLHVLPRTSIDCRRFVIASRRAFTSSSVGWPVMTVEVAARSLKRDLASSGIIMVMATGEEVKKINDVCKRASC